MHRVVLLCLVLLAGKTQAKNLSIIHTATPKLDTFTYGRFSSSQSSVYAAARGQTTLSAVKVDHNLNVEASAESALSQGFSNSGFIVINVTYGIVIGENEFDPSQYQIYHYDLSNFTLLNTVSFNSSWASLVDTFLLPNYSNSSIFFIFADSSDGLLLVDINTGEITKYFQFGFSVLSSFTGASANFVIPSSNSIGIVSALPATMHIFDADQWSMVNSFQIDCDWDARPIVAHVNSDGDAILACVTGYWKSSQTLSFFYALSHPNVTHVNIPNAGLLVRTLASDQQGTIYLAATSPVITNKPATSLVGKYAFDGTQVTQSSFLTVSNRYIGSYGQNGAAQTNGIVMQGDFYTFDYITNEIVQIG